MVIHPFPGLELVDPAISLDDPASWRSHDIAVGRHFDDPATPLVAETRAVSGLADRTGRRRTDYQHSGDLPSLLEVCIHAQETALSTDLFPATTDKFLNGTEGSGAGALPSCRLNFVIPTLSNRSQHFPHSTGWKDHPLRDIDAERAPNRG